MLFLNFHFLNSRFRVLPKSVNGCSSLGFLRASTLCVVSRLSLCEETSGDSDLCSARRQEFWITRVDRFRYGRQAFLDLAQNLPKLNQFFQSEPENQQVFFFWGFKIWVVCNCRRRLEAQNFSDTLGKKHRNQVFFFLHCSTPASLGTKVNRARVQLHANSSLVIYFLFGSVA